MCLCRLGVSLQASLLQIVGYRGLLAEVEKLRREPYDCENPEHEETLMKVHGSGRKSQTVAKTFMQVFNLDLKPVVCVRVAAVEGAAPRHPPRQSHLQTVV